MNTVYPIIGISGTFASGKDTLAHYLAKEHNFFHVSLGDMVRQEALLRHGSIERRVLHDVADDLRRTHGAGALVEMAIKTFACKQDNHAEYRGLVISGMRSLGEAKAVKEALGQLIFVDADVNIRYQRMVSRNRDAEVEFSLDEFIAGEQKELSSATNDDADFNIQGIKDMSDDILINDGHLEDFLQRANKILKL